MEKNSLARALFGKILSTIFYTIFRIREWDFVQLPLWISLCSNQQLEAKLHNRMREHQLGA